MFSNGRARSGVIVLPCGAGKTLTGIVAATTIKKRTMVLCPSFISIEQWRQQFKEYTKLTHKVVRLSSKVKDALPENPDEPCIILSTYSMICFQGTRASETQYIMDYISKKDWGLLILDEVQVLPADEFRSVIDLCKAHCKLGLTATLVREDDKIRDINFLIGPKLYEANWLDL